MRRRIAVVVVNWNGVEDTRECVSSIMRSGYRELAVYVVDNGSERDEAAELQSSFPAIHTIQMGGNYGYAAAVNSGVDAARKDHSDLLLVINNDTRLRDDTLSMLERAWHELGERVVLAPLILRPDGMIWAAGGSMRWPWVAGEHIGLGADPGEYTGRRRVDWASGCALFTSVAAYDEIGKLDDRFFLYLEDVDFCLRASRLGYSIWCIPEAVVEHRISKATGAIDPRIIRYYAYRNFYMAGLRNAPVPWRLWFAGHLSLSLAKVLGRNAFFTSYRHDSLYNARTRGLLDFVRRRTGKAPYEHEIQQASRVSAREGGA